MTKTYAAEREIIRKEASSRDCKYRITADGEVHFNGQMPGSCEYGWWLYAQSVSQAVRRIKGMEA